MSSERSGFLDIAAVLGREIADSAIWYQGRCNWVGATTPENGDRVNAALGPDLYGGTSGVALFLAEAAVTLGDDRMRATALGAIRHALVHAVPATDGLYAGSIGVAYAAARIARLLEAEAILRGACDLLRAWRRQRNASPAFDMVDGTAGSAAGLVALTSLVAEDWIPDVATEMGHALIQRAEISCAGLSWPSPGRRRNHNLCGFAHGAAGAGLALIELFGVTGDERFRSAGERAFDYERSWIRSDTGACPDLRGVGRAIGRDAPLPAATSWCYGAPGVVFARTRASRVLGGSRRPEGELALVATRRFVSERLDSALDDFCLCHGLAGAADALHYVDEESELALEVGQLGLDRHYGTGTGFRYGVPAGQTPGLLAGLAGIALFYLRLGDGNAPTPLLISHLDRPPARA